MSRSIIAAYVVFLACLIFRVPLEQHPATHTLILLPALALSGWLMFQNFPWLASGWNPGGYNSLFMAVLTIVFWMLPRSIDSSLFHAGYEVLKFVSIPLGVGGGLALGWPAAHPILRGFLKAQTISMLGFMSFLYIHSPVRICNAYLVDDQQTLGFGFLAAAILLAIYWTIPLMVQQPNSKNPAAGELAFR